MSPAFEESQSQPARYVVGIDLGTTNSALCFVDTQADASRIQTLPVPQLVAPAQVEAREILPSFLYQAAKNEFAAGGLSLPWSDAPQQCTGVLAREQGKLVPGRVVESAKSWLCHSGVDRTSALLPWHASEDVPRLSPVEASAAYLSHFREAWNDFHPEEPLEAQDVVITLPASFDEVARELTVDAARRAGLPRVMLIEEPQAAFYSWIHAHSENWNALVTPGQNILVCDIGGGTSDFTLIRVRSHPQDEVQFHRIAVGNHLILGGDNLDLALAHHLEERLTQGGNLDRRQWGLLVRHCRQAKEMLLSEQAPESWRITLPAVGTKLVGGSLNVDVSREEVRSLLLEGFFPQVGLDERPQKKGSGFQEFGLPYASDPAVTRYLAAFLSDHAQQGTNLDGVESDRPDVILFNGGVFVSPVVQSRVVEVIQSWYADREPGWAPIVLKNERHDLAVARGAAYYGLVSRGQGVRIAAGLPRTYYVGVGTEREDEASAGFQALCLMPAGTEPGEEIELQDQTFRLTVASPVEFPLFHSSIRMTDAAGTLVPVEREQLSALPPIRTVLRTRKGFDADELPVHLHSRLSEIGTLQIWCTEVDGPHRWQLQFDVRSATQTDQSAHVGTGEAGGVLDDASVAEVRRMIGDTFGPQGKEKPSGLAKRLARTLDTSRDDWPPTLLRQIWEMLIDVESGRQRSANHEARWLNLLGYSLRPGFGLAMDDWRVAETWKQLRGKLYFPGAEGLAEWWVLWRRIAGGVPAGQQQALANPLLTSLKDERRKRGRGKSRLIGNVHEKSESWRMLAALERLPAANKTELGNMAVDLLDDGEQESLHPALLWALARIGARQPFYGPLNEVVPIEVATEWLKRLTATRDANAVRFLAVMQIARRTGDRYRDIEESPRQKTLNWLTAHDAPEEYLELVESGGELQSEAQAQVFGESLPVGLRR